MNEIKNIGPKSRRWLYEIGITTYQELSSCDPITIFALIRDRHPQEVSLNLLWALYGAVRNKDWRSITQTEKEELKNRLREY